jgi:mono/diheme cytochrome c family protein
MTAGITFLSLAAAMAAAGAVRPSDIPPDTPPPDWWDHATLEADTLTRPQEAPDGAALYAVCASCHGQDGAGTPGLQLSAPVPDFSDCSFASREPDADWIAVAHDGGPARGFDESMPAFGEAFDDDQLQAIMDHIRTFCEDDSWPRGELNLPRPFVTEKAYPEDELVWSADVSLETPGAVGNELVYERRIGARHQIEVVVPFGFRNTADPDVLNGPSSDWKAGLGDIALGWKTALFHGLESGSIFSLGGEVKLPTGDEGDGFGKGTVVLEPFFSFGQLLGPDAFLHAQGGAEFPVDTDDASNELFWRAVLGRTWTQGEFGRAWSPMIEVVGVAEFEDESEVAWDLIPQLQVTLNTRQHVMLNVGIRVPLTDAESRSTELLVYVLWDWFDGGLFDGW